MPQRALESSERAYTLLVGPPACAKSLFILEIEKLKFTQLSYNSSTYAISANEELIFL